MRLGGEAGRVCGAEGGAGRQAGRQAGCGREILFYRFPEINMLEDSRDCIVALDSPE